jgi:hypothetical protein
VHRSPARRGALFTPILGDRSVGQVVSTSRRVLLGRAALALRVFSSGLVCNRWDCWWFEPARTTGRLSTREP